MKHQPLFESYECYHIPSKRSFLYEFSQEDRMKGERHLLELLQNWNRLGADIWKYTAVPLL